MRAARVSVVSVSLAIAMLIGIQAWSNDQFIQMHWGAMIIVWLLSIVASLSFDYHVGRWAFLGIPLVLLPYVALTAACILSPRGCL